MKIVIAEDEPLALEALKLALSSLKGVDVVGAAASGDEALALILQHKPDLAILDIAMPRLTGLDVARTASQSPRPPLFAFLTAFSDFAVSAFELDALDYLLKPFSARRLSETIERAKRRLEQGPQEAASGTVVADDDPFEREFWVPTRLGVRRLATADVLWIEAARDYVLLHSVDRTDILRARMSDLEQRLDPKELVRVHRSYFVRPAAVVETEHVGRNQFALVLVTGARVEIGRSYSDQVRQQFPGFGKRSSRKAPLES